MFFEQKQRREGTRNPAEPDPGFWVRSGNRVFSARHNVVTVYDTLGNAIEHLNFLDQIKILESYDHGVRVTLDNGYDFLVTPSIFDPDQFTINQLTETDSWRLDRERSQYGRA